MLAWADPESIACTADCFSCTSPLSMEMSASNFALYMTSLLSFYDFLRVEHWKKIKLVKKK